jgi:hypothetical protein
MSQPAPLENGVNAQSFADAGHPARQVKLPLTEARHLTSPSGTRGAFLGCRNFRNGWGCHAAWTRGGRRFQPAPRLRA